MDITRRAFTGGALSLRSADRLRRPRLAQHAVRAPHAAALAAIRAYGEAHRSFFNLPGLTLAADRRRAASRRSSISASPNADARTPITPDTLFQVGSISKLMTAALIHQFAGEGRFAARATGSTTCFPTFRCPPARDHRPAIARPCLRPSRRRPIVPGRRTVDRVHARQRIGLIRTPATTSSASSPSMSAASRSARLAEGAAVPAARDEPYAWARSRRRSRALCPGL